MYIEQGTCENDLLSLLKTGYAHNKPLVMEDDPKGGQKDVYEVMVRTLGTRH